MKKTSATTKPVLQMSRREILLGAIALVGGAATLASCGEEQVDELLLHSGEPLFFDAEQMRLLGRVVDIMIPDTDTPGALAAGAAIFVDRMMANWAAESTQAHGIAILQAIDHRAAELHGCRLADCSEEQQQQLIRDIDSSAYGPTPDVPGFRDLKSLIIAAYYTSEIGASVELQYELVPGRYIECAPLEEIGRAWAHS